MEQIGDIQLVQLPIELFKQLDKYISSLEELTYERDMLTKFNQVCEFFIKNIDLLTEELCPECRQLMHRVSKMSSIMNQIQESVQSAFLYQKALEFTISQTKGFIDQANELNIQSQQNHDDLSDRDSEIKKEFQFRKLVDESLGAYLRSLENGLQEMQNEKQKYIEELFNAKMEDEKALKKKIIDSRFRMSGLIIQLKMLERKSEEHNRTITQLNRTISQLNKELQQQNKDITFLNETIQLERNSVKVFINRHIKC